MLITLAWAGLCGLAVVLTCAGSANADPIQIREAWVAPGNWASIWLQKKDLAKHFGQSYVMDPVHYVGTPPMITALANNQVEITNLAYSTLGIAIENAGLDDLRIVSDEFQDGVPGYYSQEYMVLKDGPIQKIEDLKGKVVATNAAGSAVDVAMKAMLHKHGLEPNRDYTVVEAPFPAMKSMLAEKKVDLIPAVLPFSLRSGTAEDRPRSVRAAAGDRRHRHDRVDRAQAVYRRASRRLGGLFRGYAAYRRAGTRIRRTTKPQCKSSAIWSSGRRRRFSWAFTKQDYYHDPNLMPNLDALQKNIDMTKELGFIKSSFDVKKYSDLSIVKEAAKRLQ